VKADPDRDGIANMCGFHCDNVLLDLQALICIQDSRDLGLEALGLSADPLSQLTALGLNEGDATVPVQHEGSPPSAQILQCLSLFPGSATESSDVQLRCKSQAVRLLHRILC
jgi:hypothetical protein